MGFLGVHSAIDFPDPLGVVGGERWELSGTWAQKAAFYAVERLVLYTGNKLDNKIGFITRGGSNQELTLGLEGFLKLAFSFVVIKVKTMTDFPITGCVLVACIGVSHRTAFNPVLAVNLIDNFSVHNT